MLLSQVVGESSLSGLLRAYDHHVELVLFLDRSRMLDLESVLALLCKSSLKLSLLLGEDVPPLRDLLLRPGRWLCFSSWLAVLLSFSWRLIQSLFLLGKVSELLLKLRQLLTFLLSAPFLVVLFAQ